MYTANSVIYNYFFSFCKDLKYNNCNAQTLASRDLILPPSDCQTLSGSDVNNNAKYTIVKNDDDETKNFVRINLNGGNKQCLTDFSKIVELQMDVMCGADNDDFTVKSVDDTSDPCNVKIVVTSRNGCRIGSISAIWAWM